MVKRLLQCERVEVNLQVILFEGKTREYIQIVIFDRNYPDIGKTTINVLIHQDTDERHTALIAAVNNNDAKVDFLSSLHFFFSTSLHFIIF